MNDQFDVQLTPLGGAQVWVNSGGADEIVLDLNPDEFRQLADCFADAALNLKGYESVTCAAEEVQIGDMIDDLRVINVRPNHRGMGQTTINTTPFGWMLFENAHRITVNRRIQ